MWVVVLCALLVGLLAVPLVVAVDARFGNVAVAEARWRVRWLFGLVDVELSPAAAGTRPAAAPRAARPARKRRRKPGGRPVVAALRTRGLVRRATQLVHALVRGIRVDGWRAALAFGFEDPADTGVVYGLLAPLLVLCERRGLPVDCRPMFLESGLSGTLTAAVRVRPLSVLAAVASFLASPPVVQAVWAARQARG